MWSSRLFVAALACVRSVAGNPQAVIIDTDIGDDFDDSWSIINVIARPDLWDVRMILTSHKDTRKRAQIVAKYLARLNRTDIPIGIGLPTNDEIGGLYPWASDFDLDTYNVTSGGKLYEDGVKAAVDLIKASPGEIDILAIAPMTNLGAIADLYPESVSQVKMIYAMWGAVNVCYRNTTLPAGWCHEYNVAANVSASVSFVNASWPLTITPLDTCNVAMFGEPWERLQKANDTSHPLVATLLESIEVWSPGSSNLTYSDQIYDGVATYMAASLSRFEMEDIKLAMTDVGGTVRDDNGKSMNVAINWNWNKGGYLAFFDDLVEDLLHPRTQGSIAALV